MTTKNTGKSAPGVGTKDAENILTAYIVRSVKMQVIDCEQGSDEWFEARLGFVTASNFSKVIGKGSTHTLYQYKVGAEKLTGLREETYKSAVMENGSNTEDEARDYYAMANDCVVEQVGFVTRDKDVGGSPDGFVDEDGMIEIKCPLASTHITNILNNKIPTEYIPQIQGHLWITERQWCDFVSFNPNVIARPIHIVRAKRDAEYIKKLAGQVGLFVKELKEMVNKIRREF